MKTFEVNENNKRLVFYLMDCFHGMREYVAPKSIDVIVTSPPYNLGINYSTYNDNIPRKDYLDWLDKWALICLDVLKDDGSLFLNIGTKPSDPWVAFDVAQIIRNHLILQNTIHWIKSIYIENNSYGKEQSINVGHYKPIQSKRFLNDLQEYVFHFTKTGNVAIDRLSIGVPYKDKSNVTRWKGAKNDLHCRGNTWFVPYKTIQSRADNRPHPATFPAKLAEMCIRLHGLRENMVVLDPFLGIGNSAIACHELALNFIGFEIDEFYFNVAIDKFREIDLFP